MAAVAIIEVSNLKTEELKEDVEKLRHLDEMLKCTICYEYCQTCVVTRCSHNFCSLCIRQYIMYRTRCPLCFKELYDNDLTPNRLVDEFIAEFPQVKDRFIGLIRLIKPGQINHEDAEEGQTETWTESDVTQITGSKKDTVIESDTNNNNHNGDISSQSQGSSSGCNSGGASSHIHTPDNNRTKIVIPKMFKNPVSKQSPTHPAIATNKFPCPVCNVPIPERSMNSHLDACLKRDKMNPAEDTTINKAPNRTHLPKIVYKLLSMSALRAKTKEYGLNSSGDGAALKARLQRFTALYNAECDKINPKPVQEIVRQIEREEKVVPSFFTVKRHHVMSSIKADGNSSEEMNKHYLKQHKNSFDKLINEVKQRAGKGVQLNGGDWSKIMKSSGSNSNRSSDTSPSRSDSGSGDQFDENVPSTSSGFFVGKQAEDTAAATTPSLINGPYQSPDNVENGGNSSSVNAGENPSSPSSSSAFDRNGGGNGSSSFGENAGEDGSSMFDKNGDSAYSDENNEDEDEENADDADIDSESSTTRSSPILGNCSFRPANAPFTFRRTQIINHTDNQNRLRSSPAAEVSVAARANMTANENGKTRDVNCNVTTTTASSTADPAAATRELPRTPRNSLAERGENDGDDFETFLNSKRLRVLSTRKLVNDFQSETTFQNPTKRKK